MKKNNVLLRKNLLKFGMGFILSLVVVILLTGFIGESVSAESSIKIDLNSGEADSGSSTLDLLFLLAFIALIPTFLCFVEMLIIFMRFLLA